MEAIATSQMSTEQEAKIHNKSGKTNITVGELDEARAWELYMKIKQKIVYVF